ncbi:MULTISPECIES: 2,3-diaminopropionate biosynthesis protein SbnB [Spirulina sp. CCY15215]|uniref:2,3-diaminopropionate biosynthesis protein SbnB n=1 Tax=Spirulina sp. CCY15215 TaxID=2767591 RepID=UPI001950364C|nr:2,3-diaminopropionate biosynthesis protein SbnB [Spirulina major]
MNPNSGNLLLLTGDEIDELLRDREQDILEAVKLAYQAHDRGNTIMPANSYLRFPNKEKERIIAKPAYLGEGFEVAGIKWISSFPGNLAKNLERASAALILNSIETGRPTAILESSIISAKRTAASAALAAQYLWPQETVSGVGLVGCGLINFETLRFLLAIYPDIGNLNLYDLSPERAEQFKSKCGQLKPDLNIQICSSFAELLERSPIVSLATTAVNPHINSLKNCCENAVILHISLRDFLPEVILQADNIADDIEQVCSNNTSLHLTEQQVGDRNFIRGTLGGILNGKIAPYNSQKSMSIFNPFGLGILDMAVAKLTQTLAREQKIGTIIPSFFPKSWLER